MNEIRDARYEIRSASILEIFSSIQGEGPYVGERQIFIRFNNCNLDCSFCDVPKGMTSVKFDVAKIISKIKRINKNTKHKVISLTGGEPLLQSDFLKKLLPKLKRLNFKIYLETNATLPEQLKKLLKYIDIISADVKLPSVTDEKPYWKEHLDFLKIGRPKNIFVKVVVSRKLKTGDFKKAVSLLRKIDSKIPFVIQPATCNLQPATDIKPERLLSLQCYALRFLKNVLVIPQAHKILGVR